MLDLNNRNPSREALNVLKIAFKMLKIIRQVSS